MNTREKYAKVLASIQEIEKRRDAIVTEVTQVNLEREKLAQELIIEEKLLQSTEWVIDWQDEFNTALTAKSERTDDGIKNLVSLVEADECLDIGLEPGIDLFFESKQLTMHVAKFDSLIPFIKKHELRVDHSALILQESELNEELEKIAKLKTL